MTNFEWLLENEKDLIKCIILGSKLAKENGKPVLCESICCDDCDWYSNCDEWDENYIREWLDEEYKEPSLYEDWEIDDEIEVSDDGKYWYQAHFVRVSEEGKPLAWIDGRTSWTGIIKQSWNYARKVEE